LAQPQAAHFLLGGEIMAEKYYLTEEEYQEYSRLKVFYEGVYNYYAPFRMAFYQLRSLVCDAYSLQDIDPVSNPELFELYSKMLSVTVNTDSYVSEMDKIVKNRFTPLNYRD